MSMEIKEMAVKVKNMTKALMKELGDYGIVVGLKVDDAIEKTARKTAEHIEKSAPERTGDYAASWTHGKRKTGRDKHETVVYARKPEFRLTHLLEKGHKLLNGGRTKAYPHIAPAEKKAAEELEKELRRLL